MKHGSGTQWTWLLILLLAGGIPVLAGEVELEMDPADPDPDDGAEIGDRWNPTYNCITEEGDSIGDLLWCLAGGIAGAEGGCIPPPASGTGGTIFDRGGASGFCDPEGQAIEDWGIWWYEPPQYGFVIYPFDPTVADVTRLAMWENHASIKGLRLAVQQPNLVARIAEVTEKPDDGLLELELDGTVVVVNTAGYKKASQVNDALASQLGAVGFWVVRTGSFFYVVQGSGAGITRMSFRSTDPRIVTSDIALLPIEETPLDPNQQE